MSYRPRSQDRIEERDRNTFNRSLDDSREMLSLEARNKSNERLISHLNLQVDYLQQTNQDLDDRIRELEDGKSVAVIESKRLQNEVDRLHDELRTIDRLAQQLEQEKQDAVLTADREIQTAQTELRNSQRIGENTENRLLDANTERDRLAREKMELNSDLDAAKLDVERLNGLLDKVQADKKILSQKVQAVTAREKSLIMELEEYRTSPSKARRKVKSPSKLDSFVRSLEQERDHYREECDHLQEMLHEYKCKARGRSASPNNRSPSRLNSSKKGRNQSYEALMKERDELQSMLSKFERHMAEIQANVKVLTKERDKTNMLYEETNDELQRLRREYVRSPKSPKASVTAQAILRRVENERDASIADLRRMSTERDSLRERLKIQQEQSINERSRLEQRVEDYENKARSLNEDRIDLQGRNDALKDLNLAQEDDIKCLRLKLQDVEEECVALRNELSDVKMMKSQIQSSLDAVERDLSRKTTDLSLADDRIASQEKRISDLLREADKQTEEIASLRASTTTLDREKDALQVALDDRAERAASLDDQLSRRDREASDMRSTISSLESKVERLGDEVATSDREIRSLKRQLEGCQADLSDCNRAKEAGNRENRRLHDDLTSLTRQNQDLNIELDDVTRSRDDLKRNLDDKVLRINDLDAQLSCKEKELLDVLEQYRRVSSERDVAESRYRSSNDEAQTLRTDLFTADGDRKRGADRISVLERELSDHTRAQQSYESQITGLRSAVSELEAELDRIKSDRASLQEDLHSARDINSKLDANKEHISRQLSAKSLEVDQLKANCEDLNRELEIVHKHLDAERTGNKNLEDLVAGVREKEFQAQLDAQEQKSESQLLRDKLALNESKLQSMAREISSLRDRTSQMDAELEVTKRHLTNERYERERAVQELRRHGFPSPGLSRISRPLSPTGRSKSGSPTRLSFLDTSR